MAKYLVKEESYINGAVVQPGEIVDYDLPDGTTVSSNLELVKGGKTGTVPTDSPSKN